LDEIGDLPLNLQAKLLRVLQEKKFERVGSNVEISSDVRILSATNRDLQVMVKEGKFREDLFYRINVVEIKLPALRERIEDLPLLVEHFVSDFNKKHKKNTKKISPEAMQALGLYSWPGNVRELQHVVEKLVLFSSGDTITELDTKRFIPKEEGSSSESMITPGMTLEELRNKTEKEYFEKILAETRWNVTEAAKKAGVDRKTMYIKMSQYGIKRAE
jgi:two-component system response regulator HydG